jgi:hypothetical protein
MAFLKAPRNWLVAAAFAAAFWITFRVMAASAPVPMASPSATTDIEASLGETRDPALEQMISDFASAARRR